MKPSKAAPKTSAQEECGIWLDTVQLKEKTKKKTPTRPISKLLNPFIEGSGYSLSVALNFTQTKIEMPKTKQSTISTFFTPHRRVLNKISTSEEPDTDPVQPFSSSKSAAVTSLSSGRKRGREELTAEADVVKEWKSENVTESTAAPLQRHSPSPNMDSESEDGKFEDCESPQSWRRPPDSSLSSDSQPLPQAWSQDPLFTPSQYSETDQKRTTENSFTSPEETFPHSLRSEETFKNVMNGERRTSTQKSVTRCHSPENDDDQENSFPPPKFPSQHSFVSNHNWTEPKPPSSRKHLDLLWKKTEKEESFDSRTEWLKQKSPLKKRARRSQNATDEDSLAALFTQDSQGFRVIAHRGLQARSPLKDQSNVKTYRSVVVEEDEDDFLFTQDSQGNLVIKH